MTGQTTPVPAAGPLAGVKVVDLSRWIAGPLCTMLLADLGADVIKVERPGGEEVRALEPRIGDESAYLLHYNRNKRAITVNSRDEAGVAVLRDLIAWADVLVQNYRPGTLEEMGLDAEELDRLNPDLVVTDISGYGQTGPWRHRPLFNSIAEASTGAMSLTGDVSTGPLMSGTFMADHTAGLYAAFATVTALLERQRSGRGQRADVALFDALLSVLGYPLTASLNGLPAPEPTGNRDKTAVPGDLYPTADGRHVYIDAGTDRLFAALREAMGQPAELADERFDTGPGRWALVDDLDALIEKWTTSNTADEVSARLDAAGVPHGIVHTMDEVARHQLLEARQMVAEVDAGDSALRLPGVTVKFSRTPGSVRSAPPRVGEHTDTVLAEICGRTPDEIEALRRLGAI